MRGRFPDAEARSEESLDQGRLRDPGRLAGCILAIDRPGCGNERAGLAYGQPMAALLRPERSQ